MYETCDEFERRPDLHKLICHLYDTEHISNNYISTDLLFKLNQQIEALCPF